ncbi:aminopeptidase P family protein [Flavobacteriaceae bacterium]|uniref:M24 family metallopeptidase n=1 Tax=Candidatus Arcticimaribacter forsetii TaxID=2820661 RepID=UPI002077765C|nr:M24 family metallopeptidase [Candidatus Arcticimaribacter forsetii]MDB2325982.1 aminopeptidase P family protein [Flavobacteriaceae bacterium]MDB2329941.1 aminopeptidase P family protein [Flavobacteriaceae bacterium]MDB2346209.1 aminopeptidase P family protein [Flavobacteriaceae bacterium]MDB4674524.1 aminopeptidase P family protein [Flavobacteriaceae bacterium]
MNKFWKLFLFLIPFLGYSQQILPLKDRAVIIDEIQKDRLENLLPRLMEEADLDMWVLITREYNEDPIIKTLLPPTWLNARRQTILVFSRDKNSGEINSAAITRYPFGKNIPSIWNKEKQPDQWQALADYIVSINPKNIGVNISKSYALADGLVKTDYDELIQVLPDTYKSKVVSAEKLAVGWIETRTPKEMIIFEDLVRITHQIIAEAFSNKVITPGETTTDDVVWWLREKVLDLGLTTWFHPTVDVQRADKSDLYAFDNKAKFDVIQPGDLVHCDFGISYLTLNTDCQELAYVLRPDEDRAPEFLVQALADGNRVQDIFTNNFKEGLTGNEILKKSLKEGRSEGLRPQIYTHPLGTYGHSAGTTLGMWDSQNGVAGTGDYPLHFDTTYAIELNTKVFISQWNKDIRVMLEEAGFFGENGFRYVNKRQEELLLIASSEKK